MQSTATLQAQVASSAVQQARRGLVLFFAFLVPATALLEGLMIVTGQFEPWVMLLMCIPALASVIARITLREGFGDVSFRMGGRRGLQAILLSLIVPVVVGLVAYGSAWSIGLAEFAPPAFPAVEAPLARFGLQFISVLGIGFLFSLILSAGEEIGWRGYMLTRLIDAGVPQPVLVSGLIWGLWHVPLIVSGLYAAGPYPLLSALLFMPGIIAITFLISQLRLTSGSIWPAIILHAAWNTIIQGVFDESTSGAQGALWVGESGILVMVAVVATVALLNHIWRPASEASAHTS
jgi:membrane protease YdiL (CAAX protease family)